MVVILDRQLRREIEEEVYGVCSNCKAPTLRCCCTEELEELRRDEINDYVNR